MDGQGNFSLPVTLEPGINEFVVQSFTGDILIATETIQLVGAVNAVMNINDADSIGALQQSYRNTTFNRSVNQLHVGFAATNEDLYAYATDIGAVFDIPDAPSASFVADRFDGQTDQAESFLILDEEVSDGILSPAETSEFVSIAVANPQRQRFSVDVDFRVTPNQAPIVTSTPELIAPAGTEFSYEISATDFNQDLVSFEILAAPTGSTFTTGADGTALLNWTPTADDLGNHQVSILVDDGRGGTAEQRFDLLVPSDLDNQAPLITSQLDRLDRFATLDELFTYDIEASDPEGDLVSLSLGDDAPAGVAISGNQLTWTPQLSDVGTQEISIIASDVQGATSTQTLNLIVRGTNEAPVFVSTPVETASSGGRYRYFARAEDANGDSIIYSLEQAAPGMTISPTGGLISFLPSENEEGQSYEVRVVATDELGLSTTQNFTVAVEADQQAPEVAIYQVVDFALPGEEVTVQVFATDDVGVESLDLTINGQLVSLDDQQRATFIPSEPGLLSYVATSTDAAGNIGTETAAVRILDVSDVTAPFVQIESPTDSFTVEYLTDVIGTVAADDVFAWTLEYSLITQNQWVTIASATAEGAQDISLDSEFISVFDPTLLENNQYELRLSATDFNGNTASDIKVVNLEGNAKIGVNLQSVVDLTIPVAGGPAIELHRQHSQLNANQNGEFGNGWSFCTTDADIRESIARSEFEDLVGQFAALAFSEGDKVYITTPDCQRIGFTFSPTPNRGIWSVLNPNFFDARWIPDPGSEWQLYGESDLPQLASGRLDLESEFTLPLAQFQNQYIIAQLGVSYNPQGYYLVNKDGTQYSYSDDGTLREITDRNNNSLTYGDEGFTSSSGQEVQFQRDDLGRITQVIDPDGNVIDYSYDEVGNLLDVQYPNGLSNSYQYTAENYLAAVNTDDIPEQVTITTGFEYDVAGRLFAAVDALGATNTFSYSIGENTRITFDALGQPTEVEYDDRGNLIREISANGNEAFYEYDADDNLTKLTDERGFVTTMTYDDNRNLTSMEDALGNITSITYDRFSNVTEMVRADGEVHTYTMDDRGNTIRVQLPGGTDATIEYDDQGRVIRSTDVDGGVKELFYDNLSVPIRTVNRDGTSIEYIYDSRGKITSITDERGNSTTLNLDNRSRLDSIVDALGGTVEFVYDGSVLSSRIDHVGDETSFIYDKNNRPLRITDGEGGVIQLTYDANGNKTTATDENGNVTRYEYREDTRLVKMIDALGGETEYEYDPAGNRTAMIDQNDNRWEWEYDALGYVSASVAPNGDRVDFEYDAMGNLISETDALGRTVRYEYGPLNLPTKIINPAGDAMTMVYDWETNLLSETDINNNTHVYEYDSRNRLIKTTDPIGNEMEYGYDLAGNKTTMTDERGFVSSIEYDELNRPVRWSDPTDATYVREYDANSRLISSTDPTGAKVSFEYDTLDRIVKQIDALDGETTWTYDLVGNMKTTTDPINRTTSYGHDKLNRTISMTDPRGGVTEYAYDAKSNLLSINDPVDNASTFEYDTRDRLVKVTDALGNFSTTTYDAVSNVTEIVDRNGRTNTYTYDVLDRLTSETWFEADGSVANTLSYSYDDIGNLLSAGDDYSQYTYTYDGLHRLTSNDNAGTENLPNVVFTYDYDASSNRISISDNAGVEVLSEYDSRNQLSSRQWFGAEIDDASLTMSYDSRGLPTEIQRYGSLDGSNLVSGTEFTFDAKVRLTEMLHNDSSGQNLIDYQYTRDLDNQLIAESHHGQSFDYSRDATGQLLTTQVDGALTEDYSYDLNGNRTSDGSVTLQDNRLAEDHQYTYDYDAEGNMTRRSEKATGDYTEYSYDNRNRLVEAEDYSSGGILLASVSHVYDVHDRMITRSFDADGAGPLDSEVRHMIYDGDNTWADYDENSAATARYLFGDGIDQLTARWRPGEGTAWYLTDHLGTVRDILDSTGAVANTITYDSYGQISIADQRAFW